MKLVNENLTNECMKAATKARRTSYSQVILSLLAAVLLVFMPTSYAGKVYSDNMKNIEILSPNNPDGKWIIFSPFTSVGPGGTLNIKSIKGGIELSSDYSYLANPLPGVDFGDLGFGFAGQHFLSLVPNGVSPNGSLGPFRLAEDELIEVTLVVSVQLEGIYDNIFGITSGSAQEIVLGFAGIILGNTDADGIPVMNAAQTACVFIDNHRVYAFQDTFFRKTSTELASRNPTDVHVVKVIYDRKHKEMRWIIDGELKAVHSNFGFRPTGINPITGLLWNTTAEIVFEQNGGDDEFWQVLLGMPNSVLDHNIAGGGKGFVQVDNFYATPTQFLISAEDAKLNRADILLTPNGKLIKMQLYKLKVEIRKSK